MHLIHKWASEYVENGTGRYDDGSTEQLVCEVEQCSICGNRRGWLHKTNGSREFISAAFLDGVSGHKKGDSQ